MSEHLEAILADCLREHADSYTAKAILKEFPTVRDIMNASEDELRLIKSIGPIRAKQLSAIVKFAKCAYSSDEDKVTIKSPEDAYNFMRGKLEILEIEQGIVFEANKAKVGKVIPAIIDYSDVGSSIGRTQADAPEIDCTIKVDAEEVSDGEIVLVKVTGFDGYDLEGERIEA